PKTDSGRRTLTLSDVLSDVLIRWKLAQREEAEALGELWTDTGYVFTMPVGQPLKPQYATRTFEKLRRMTNLPKMTFHGQRHESASLLLASGT
ncbi:hypothetical protein SB767_30450, partial [Bacillus sp. SIMBA_069]